MPNLPTSNLPTSNLPTSNLPTSSPALQKLRENVAGQKANLVDRAKEPKPIRSKTAAFDRLQFLEDSMREESFAIVDSVLKFADIDKDAETIPPAWVKEHGPDRAIKMFRLAKYGQMSAKEAPVAIKVAAQVCSSIIKAKGGELNNRPLNLTLVKVTSNFTYDSVDVED